jgi:hypothetical protein
MRRPLVLGLSVLLATTFAATAIAEPITIDFDELTSNDAQIRSVGGVYSVDGFTFTAVMAPFGNDPAFLTIGTLSSSFDGSTSIYNGNSLTETVLTRSDGGRFNLFSIDLAELPNFDGTTGKPIDLGSFFLTFYGTRFDGSVVEATAKIGPFPDVTTFAFSGFTNLLSVEWTQGPGGAQGPTHQFDNVRVNEVPEPGTLLLLVTGVLAVGRWRRTRSSSPAVVRTVIAGPPCR